MTEQKLFSIRELDDNEMQEVSQYIQQNVPFTILQKVFILTENAIEKATNFNCCYRIINTAKNLVSQSTTREKLERLLSEDEQIYEKLYSLLLKEDTAGPIIKAKIRRNVIAILEESDSIKKVNNLIDVFLIMGEKFELLDTNKVAGLNLDNPAGQQVYKEINAISVGSSEKKEDVLTEQNDSVDETSEESEDEEVPENLEEKTDEIISEEVPEIEN